MTASRRQRGVALRTNLILSGIIVVLLVIAITGARTRSTALDPSASSAARLFDGFEAASAHQIHIARAGGEALILQRSGPGAWQITTTLGYPADPRKVSTALAKLTRWRRDVIVGGAAEHDPMAVGETTSTRVTVKGADGAVLVDAHIGKMGGLDPDAARERGGQLDPSQLTVYVRRADEDRVYIIRDFLLGTFGTRPEDWLDRPLLGLRADQVVAIEARRHAGDEPPPALRLAREEPDAPWEIGERRLPPDESAVTRIVNALCGLAPSTVVGRDVPDRASLGLDPPRAEIVATTSEGEEHRLLVGDAVDPDAAVKSYHVQQSGSPFVVTANASQVDAVLATPDAVVARQVAPFPPQKVVSLAINVRPPPLWNAPIFAGGPLGASAFPPRPAVRPIGLLLRRPPEQAEWYSGAGQRPVQVPREAVLELLGEMTRLPVADFHARGEPDPTFGLADPMLAWEVLLEDGTRYRLSVGRPAPGGPDGTRRRYARAQGSEWTVTVDDTPLSRVLMIARQLVR